MMKRCAWNVLAVITLAAAFAAPQAGAQAQVTQTEAAQANTYFTSQDWENSVTAYRAIVEKNPTAAGAWYRLGYALHALQQYDEALKTHMKAAEFPAVRANALYNAGCVHALQDRPDEALELIAQSVKVGMGNANWMMQDPDLESLREMSKFKKLVSTARRLGPRQTSLAEQRQFDFWVGSWIVQNKAGQQVGTNVITLRQNGAIVHEAWTNAQGGTGESINFVDPKTRKWRQVWVAAGGQVVEYEGEWRNEAIHFTGRRTNPNGVTILTRCSFTPLEDGRVRQFIEDSKDGGETWTPSFEGFYSRVEPAKPAPNTPPAI